MTPILIVEVISFYVGGPLLMRGSSLGGKMISKRLLIFVEGGVVQALLSPDREEDFDIIIKDVDRLMEGENPCFFMPVDSGLTSEEWQEYVDRANEEEDKEDE